MNRPEFDRTHLVVGEWAAQASAYDDARRTQNRKAARVVAGRATDVMDCRDLLDMLGLGADADERRS
jgi:hypothetical protein